MSLWELPLLEPRLLRGHAGLVLSVAVAPDNRLAASGGEDGTIIVWALPAAG
jgi:WD40 repeat protein